MAEVDGQREPLGSGDAYERVLEQHACGTGDTLQIPMQHGVGRAAIRAFGAVALEGAEALQKVDEVARALAVQGGQGTGEAGQRRVVEAWVRDQVQR